MVIIIYAFKVQTLVKSATATRNTENCKYNCFAGKLHDTHYPCQERPITVHVVIITNKRKRCVCSLPLQFNFIFFFEKLSIRTSALYKLYFLTVLNFRKAPSHQQYTSSNVVHFHQIPKSDSHMPT